MEIRIKVIQFVRHCCNLDCVIQTSRPTFIVDVPLFFFIIGTLDLQSISLQP